MDELILSLQKISIFIALFGALTGWLVLISSIVELCITIASGTGETKAPRYNLFINFYGNFVGLVSFLAAIDYISQLRLNYWEQLTFSSDNYFHAIIQPQGWFIIGPLMLLGSICTLILYQAKKLPPLLTVILSFFSILNIIVIIMFLIQTIVPLLSGADSLASLFMPIYAIYYIIFVLITFTKIYFKNRADIQHAKYTNKVLNFLQKIIFIQAKNPFYVIVFLFPILFIIHLILLLFGQPTGITSIYTETSDWTLSLQQAPESVFIDPHYLCTVAAKGNPKKVKPLRYGWRVDHVVVVNRQLQVSNAFEEVLALRLPFVHTMVRRFYNNYGRRLAESIKSEKIATITYYLMKPLEWFFLIVLYCHDIYPEKRIERQYEMKKEK